ERAKLRDEINASDDLQERMRLVRRHLEIHQSIPRVRPAAGSFLRLTTRMRNEGYLAYAYPGWHSLWRRSVGIGLAAALMMALVLWLGLLEAQGKSEAGVPFGSFLRANPDGTKDKRTISLGTSLSTGPNGGYLWLSTPARGVSTEVIIDSTASFQLRSLSELELTSGALDAVFVKQAALYPDGFVISTRHGSLVVRDADFSVEAQSGRTIVNVARGRVEVRRPNSSEARIVSAGMCADLIESQPLPQVYGFLRVDIQPINFDRVAAINIANRTQWELKVRTILWNFGEAYRCRLSKDLLAGDGEQYVYRGSVPLAPTAESHTGPRFLADDLVVLESAGKADTYQFVADLTAETLGWDAKDMSFTVDYLGEIHTEHFGILHVPAKSRVERINLKLHDAPTRNNKGS
ncbi:MAG: FecR domain-containing protein, partial [Planctomycetes bacterium]|nr:FecR domain-containing protein [Planctomycetota bacterium]